MIKSWDEKDKQELAIETGVELKKIDVKHLLHNNSTTEIILTIIEKAGKLWNDKL